MKGQSDREGASKERRGGKASPLTTALPPEEGKPNHLEGQLQLALISFLGSCLTKNLYY